MEFLTPCLPSVNLCQRLNQHSNNLIKYVSPHISISIYLSVLIILSGCVSLSTYQSPKILDKGDAQVGVGMLAGFGEIREVALGEVSLIGRYGISDRMDIGAKIYGLPHLVQFYSLYGDLRYQLLTEPLYVSGAFGVSTFHVEDYRSTGLYPTIMFGTERIYGGVKWIRMISSSDEMEESLGTNFAGVVAGATFGKRLSFMPELNVYFADEELLFFPGVGLTYNF